MLFTMNKHNSYAIQKMISLHFESILFFYLIVVLLSSGVLGFRESSPPIITSLSRPNVTILAQGNALFECKVRAYPPAIITWKKNNRRLNDKNKKFRIIQDVEIENLSYLRVTYSQNFQTRNSLNVTCEARNYYGTTEATAQLNIIPDNEMPVDFPHASISNPKSVEPDTLFSIECNVTSHIQPFDVKWYQSNKEINFIKGGKYYSNSTQIDKGIL
jgi:hypothetical protein